MPLPLGFKEAGLFPSDALFPSEHLWPGLLKVFNTQPSRDLTDTARARLDDIPPWATQDYDIAGAIQAMSNEVDRIDAVMDEIVNTFFPQLATDYLYLWEASLGIAMYPEGLTTAQRQQRVLAFYLQRYNKVPGSSWVQSLNVLLGPGWSWTRHIPHAVGGVGTHTILITLPFAVDSAQANDLVALIELITPANTFIDVAYGVGFIIQQSLIQSQPI